MNKHSSATRALAVANTFALSEFALSPSYAATDFDLLKQYVGDWKGRGVMTGAQQESVLCRMSLTEGNQEKVNYSGRCTLAGTTLSINGTVAYIPQNKRFEAAMTTNAGFTSVAAGQKRGDQIVFNMQDREQDEAGNPMEISASMVLAGGKINVSFEVVFVETGDRLKAQVPFSR